ncbi:MAG: hypothetical protein M0R23_05385 [Bacteroidales bacterium]|nr:hypothetical protein [Bacteroidales bacterium]
MKRIIYSLVIMIAAGSLFTSCIENVEPEGVYELRLAKAAYYEALANLKLADAKVAEADATYRLAEASYQDALTAGQVIANQIEALRAELIEAQNAATKETLLVAIQQLQANNEVTMVNLAKQLAQAQAQLEAALKDIAFESIDLTAEQQLAYAAIVHRYRDAMAEYTTAAGVVVTKQQDLIAAQVAIADGTVKENLDNQLADAAEELANAKSDLANVKLWKNSEDIQEWVAELEKLQDTMDMITVDSLKAAQQIAYNTVDYNPLADAYTAAAAVTASALAAKTTATTTYNTAVAQRPVTVKKYTVDLSSVQGIAKAKFKLLLQTSVDRDFAKGVWDELDGQTRPLNSPIVAGDSAYVNLANLASDEFDVYASYDSKGFIMDGEDYEYTNEADVDKTLSAQMGLNGMVSWLKEMYAEQDTAGLAAKLRAAVTARNTAKTAWEAVEGNTLTQPSSTAWASAFAGTAYATAYNKLAAGTYEFLYSTAATSWYIHTTLTAADTTAYVNAFKNFYTQREAYWGIPADTLRYVERTFDAYGHLISSETISVNAKDLSYALLKDIDGKELAYTAPNVAAQQADMGDEVDAGNTHYGDIYGSKLSVAQVNKVYQLAQRPAVGSTPTNPDRVATVYVAADYDEAFGLTAGTYAAASVADKAEYARILAVGTANNTDHGTNYIYVTSVVDYYGVNPAGAGTSAVNDLDYFQNQIGYIVTFNSDWTVNTANVAWNKKLEFLIDELGYNSSPAAGEVYFTANNIFNTALFKYLRAQAIVDELTAYQTAGAVNFNELEAVIAELEADIQASYDTFKYNTKTVAALETAMNTALATYNAKKALSDAAKATRDDYYEANITPYEDIIDDCITDYARYEALYNALKGVYLGAIGGTDVQAQLDAMVAAKEVAVAAAQTAYQTILVSIQQYEAGVYSSQALVLAAEAQLKDAQDLLAIAKAELDSAKAAYDALMVVINAMK